MDLKKIKDQIAALAQQLPIDLCKGTPVKFDIKVHRALQAGVLLAANLVEQVNTVVGLLAEEVQNLRDEVNELKGEQGKPDIRAQAKSASDEDKSDSDDDNANGEGPASSSASDISSEKERSDADKAKKQKRTNKEITVTREEKRTLNKTGLPVDLIFKGYMETVVQDIVFTADNVKFQREIYYSPSSGKTYVADLPNGFSSGGGYGDNLKAFVITLHHEHKVSQPEVYKLLNNAGVLIAKSTISRMLTENHEVFHQEKDEIISSAFATAEYMHMDDTGARVNGQNYYTHVLCNELITAYFTRQHKDRMTILSILRQGTVEHLFNQATYDEMLEIGLSAQATQRLIASLSGYMNTLQLTEVLNRELGVNGYATAKKAIIEISAIVAYQNSPQALAILVCDDAPQFKEITSMLALCWVHAARHYKKLLPVVPAYKIARDEFLTKLWDYYKKLLAFKQTPLPKIRNQLSVEFDELFSTTTGYTALDVRIAKTKSQKAELLVSLYNPNVPLHNNAAELAARAQARRRDISFQTINEKGTSAKDTFMTIIETAKKLGVNAFEYIRDTISGKVDRISLAELIKMRTWAQFTANTS